MTGAERPCVYSVLFGGYEELQEQPVAKDSSVDFVLFTDDSSLSSSTWDIRVVDRILAGDSVRSARFPKLLPHRALPEYDASIYIDNRVLLRATPERILEDLLGAGDRLVINRHDHRDTVRDEFRAVVDLGKDSSWVCEEQLQHYETSYPAVLDSRPLWSGFMLRRHNGPQVIHAMETWWTHVLRYSRRDQLSLNIALETSSLAATVLDNPLSSSDYYQWPIEVGRGEDRPAPPTPPPGSGLYRNLPKEAIEREHALKERIEALEASTSWRLTAPVRWLGDRLRGRR